MKRLMITLFAAFAAFASSATEVQYKDVVNQFDSWMTNRLNNLGVTFETRSEIKDLKYAEANTLIQYAKKNRITSEVDDYISSSTNVSRKIEWWAVGPYVTKTDFPKYYEILLQAFYKDKPVMKKIMSKYGVLKFSNKMACNDMISVVNSGELNSIGLIDSLNNKIKNEGVKIVKRYLRGKGKTFVSSKRVVDGNTVLVNPLETPMKELTDSLNGRRYAGFNEWIDKYGASWTKIDLSWLESEDEMKAVMNDILLDEKSMHDYSVRLRLHLGVDGFNAFVKEYNEGVTE